MTGGTAAISTDPSATPAENLQRRLASLARMSKQDVPPEAFFLALLRHFDQDVPLRWAVVWTRCGNQWHRLAQLNGQATSDPSAAEQQIATHAAAAISEALASDPPAVHRSSVEGSGSLLTLAVGDNRNLVLQVFPVARPSRSHSPQSGQPPSLAAQLLEAYGQLSDDFGRNRALRSLHDQVALLRRAVRVSQSVHASLELDRTAFEIVSAWNELAGCQRASLLVRDRQRFRVAAVSGLAILDHRSPLIRSLVNLATAVAASRQRLIYGLEPLTLPPQLAQPLDACLDQSHATGLLAVPLSRGASDSASGGEPTRDADRAGDAAHAVIGVLIVEVGDLAALTVLREQTAALSTSCAVALGNALEHSTLPLRRAAGALRRLSRLCRWRDGGRLALAVAGAAILIAALIWTPAPLRIAAVGELRPAQIDHAFAPRDGYVSEIFVEHNQAVQPGTPLLTVHSPDLELELRRIEGAIESTQQQLRAAEAARRRGTSEPADLRDDAARFAAGESHLRAVLQSYEQQLALLRAEQANLQLHSDLDGTVLTWQVQQTLRGRPVQRGQQLLQIAAADSPWIISLAVPDQDVGHVLKAQSERFDLAVEYILATQPQRRLSGRVIEVARITTLSDAGQPVVEVQVEVDRSDLVQPRAGAQVQAEILCGTHSLGYVWFHRLWDALWSRILF